MVKSKISNSHIWISPIVGVTAILIILILYSVVMGIAGRGDDTNVAQEAVIEYMRPLSPEDRYKWRSTSKYTLVIYESLDCKYCRKLNAEILKNISYLRGKFNLVYRNAPLVDLEPLATEKSLIAECVYRDSGVDRMFEMVDLVYANYQVFQRDNNWVKTIAKKVMIHPETLESCMNDPIQKSKIENDIQDLTLDSVNSTPSIGIYYDGRLVGRYASGFNGTMRVIKYLSTFEDNADQFWSDALFDKIRNGRI